MSKPVIICCPSLLTAGYDTYSPRALNQLFGRRKVSHMLDYDSPWFNDADDEAFMENTKRISISGVQEKYSLIQQKNSLRLTENGEQGTHILKPVALQLKRARELPANEHVTMQIAAQVYGIDIGKCGLIFFRNGDNAYVTKRFDILPNGQKLAKEDFATLAGKSIASGGKNFKYDGSYELIGQLIRRYVPAWRVEIEKFFSLVIFNFLFSNGDAHLKNFGLLETSNGDHVLCPAYDLVNTHLHIDDQVFAMDRGLFEDDYRSPGYRQYGHVCREDFMELSRRFDMTPSRTLRILQFYGSAFDLTEYLVAHSFLGTEAKKIYLADYRQRLNHFNTP